MKPVQNELTLYYKVGEKIIYKYSRWRQQKRGFIVVGHGLCMTNPCRGCTTGGVGYLAKPFRKRPGRKIITICGNHGVNPDYLRWNPETGETYESR